MNPRTFSAAVIASAGLWAGIALAFDFANGFTL